MKAQTGRRFPSPSFGLIEPACQCALTSFDTLPVCESLTADTQRSPAPRSSCDSKISSIAAFWGSV